MECGAVVSDGFGPQPFPFAEIDAIKSIYRLDDYEALTIRKMSVAYCAGLKAGKNPFSIEPWGRDND